MDLKRLNSKVSRISLMTGENNVIIHSDITNLVLFKYSSKDHYLGLHLENLQNIFSDYNIWMPSFNYEFCKTRKFNVETEKVSVGILNDFFRKKSRWRTTTPVFSISGNGNYPLRKFFNGNIINPFSLKSEFDYLYNTNSLYCHYGSNMGHTTLIHYVEGIFGNLLYRYRKFFEGSIIFGNCKINITLNYHVRPINQIVEFDIDKIFNDLKHENLIFDFYLNGKINYITLFSVKNVVDFWITKLHQDPFYFLNDLSKQWIIPKIDKLGRGFELSDFE